MDESYSLEYILKKIDFDSIEEYLENEKRIKEKYHGYEIERKTPLSNLTFEEIKWFRNYCVEHSLV